ncbi:hypothetical protein WN873_01955 [Tetragenococcus halophilus]|uniref:hypothetical protein n=1 Tax=Tetragenococcus halophilus TaxID=51669 RepID=UPI0030F0C610
MKIKQGRHFKITILNKTYTAVITHVNKDLYIVDFYYQGEFETSKAVKKHFFKDNKEIIEWSGQSGNA